MQISNDIQIPALRQDLQIHKGGLDKDGSPTWMLYDPLSDNYFKIGWFEFECLQRFERVKTGGALVQLLNKETTLSVDLDDVKGFVGFLAVSELLRADTKEMQAFLKARRDEKKPKWQNMFVKYVFMTIPLFKPNNFLKATFPYIRFLYTRQFFIFVLCLLGVGIFLTFQRLDDFLHSFTTFFSLQGLFLIFVSTVFIKMVHEFGHAYMAHKHKVPVSTIGVVLIVFYPLLYTETTNAWRLYDRRKRLQIAAAGLMSELALASFALLLWHVTSPGLLQNLAYYVAFLSITISVLVNMNPLMKFDGYYLLSDVLGIDNLQTRAVMFFKWRLRYYLLGLKDAPPEQLDDKTQRFLTAFGVALVVYRFFLYLGIGVAIYWLFFKPLGFLLMLLALVIFIGIPVWRELAFWYQERARILSNLVPKLLVAVLALLFVFVFLPVHSKIKIPGVLHAGHYTALHASIPARVDSIKFKNGQTVSKGDVLFVLSSDFLDKEIQMARSSLELYQTVRQRQQASPDLAERNTYIDQLILETQARLSGLLAQEERLTIVAPFDGVVTDLVTTVHEGRWVNSDILLARVINNQTSRVTAYVSAEVVDRIKMPASARFKSDSVPSPVLNLRLAEMAGADTKAVDYAELSSLYGGVIPADLVNETIMSRKPLYRLNFEIDGASPDLQFTEKGLVVLRVQPISFAGKIVKRLLSILIRETGI